MYVQSHGWSGSVAQIPPKRLGGLDRTDETAADRPTVTAGHAAHGAKVPMNQSNCGLLTLVDELHKALPQAACSQYDIGNRHQKHKCLLD